LSTLTVKPSGIGIGAEIVGVDIDRLLHDEDLPNAVLEALEEHGVIFFREINVDDDTQVKFARKLGELVKFPNVPPAAEEIMEVSFDPANGNAEYLAANAFWHIDGLTDEVMAKASILTGRVLSETGGETEFASTYTAYDDLSDEEKERFSKYEVIHTFEMNQRTAYPNPTEAQLEEWASRPERRHPLVWEHESGRRSLVFGISSSEIVGMDIEEGRALLNELVARATTPDRVYQHKWSLGDMVIWDNTGVLHRVLPFDRTKPRVMNRTTLVGREPIK
jgi:alpha-ketoglutarate-dependent taurine dioxygenase